MGVHYCIEVGLRAFAPNAHVGRFGARHPSHIHADSFAGAFVDGAYLGRREPLADCAYDTLGGKAFKHFLHCVVPGDGRVEVAADNTECVDIERAIDTSIFCVSIGLLVFFVDDEAGRRPMHFIPEHVKGIIGRKNISLYIINATKIAAEIGLGGRTNTILQSAFFKITNIIPYEDAVTYMKQAILKSYGKKGENVVNMNYAAVDRGGEYTKVEIPADWKDITAKFENPNKNRLAPEFVKEIADEVNSQCGDRLPVSKFVDIQDGTMPNGTAAYEKRGVAVKVPEWKSENCIQCNTCAFVCPHAAIRPIAMTEEEAANAPAGTVTKDLTGMPGYKFAIVVSSLDCTGCGSCANVCPGNMKAATLTMTRLDEAQALPNQQTAFDYAVKLPIKNDVVEKFKETTVKGSQFKQPLLEFSGACAGCGETPYIKLITQLFGDRMYVANATGCSSIWGNSSPSTPYTVNAKGHGPAWSNSLFEDAAEFGYGMFLANDAIRSQLKAKVEAWGGEGSQEYLDTFTKGAENGTATEKLIAALEADGSDAAKDILKEKDYLAKKSQWIFGGDGWAFDIGYGGVDHVLASGKDVNIFVVNTEVYSNTGGQSSKATPEGAVAQFAAAGKETVQKDLAAMAMSYGYVYVAQISMGADRNQCIKAIAEAEA